MLGVLPSGSLAMQNYFLSLRYARIEAKKSRKIVFYRFYEIFEHGFVIIID